jgi:glycosyltransferase involved in cell wall biosynthesis
VTAGIPISGARYQSNDRLWTYCATLLAMLNQKKIIVVLPAYNAEKTLEVTYREIPLDIVDEVILVDDSSSDKTVCLANNLNIPTIVHSTNLGYGGNQKTCYAEALDRGADIVVMLHPDYQYSPLLIPSLAGLVASGHYDVALGSRIIGGLSLQGGMPLYKYYANRLLTFIQNMVLGAKLSEYHTGFRAFSRKVLETLPLNENSNDFVFDNEVLAQAIFYGFRLGEISCPTRYMEDASSINFRRSVHYGFGVLGVTVKFFLAKFRLIHSRTFKRGITIRSE